MTRRRWKIGALGVLVLGGLSAAALANRGFRGHGPHKMMRFMTKAVDRLLDKAAATPEQRTAIHGTRDRLMATLEEHGNSRGAHLEEALALFVADRVDPAAVAAMRASREAEMRAVGDAVVQAITEVHDVLTPEQRRIVADAVREHHARRRERRGSFEKFRGPAEGR